MTNDIKAIAEAAPLPCPFCGSTETEWTMLAGWAHVAETCANGDCLARGPLVQWASKHEPIAETVAPARAAWNTRSITTLEAENASLREALQSLNNAACMVLVGLNQRIKEADLSAVPVFYGIVDLSDAIHVAAAALSTQGTTDKENAS